MSVNNINDYELAMKIEIGIILSSAKYSKTIDLYGYSDDMHSFLKAVEIVYNEFMNGNHEEHTLTDFVENQVELLNNLLIEKA